MTSAFPSALMTTGIGSLPLEDAEQAAAFVLDAGLSIPFWPQLPRRDFREQMIAQFAERMPCARIDAGEGRISFDDGRKYEELEPFYAAYLSGELDYFGLSAQAAAGLPAFEGLAAGRTWPIVKGQVTGPVTFSTSIASADKAPLYGDADLRDAAVKLLARHAQWQVRRLAPLASEKVLIFVDEPVLAAYGSSSYLGISEEDVWQMTGEIFEAIVESGGITGMHVCGNSDWGVMLRTGVQVLNFDAYQYGSTVALYPEEVSALFDRGGWIAWGIVPTGTAADTETPGALAGRFEQCLDALAAKGLGPDLVRSRSLLTPSCGTGSIPPARARKVFDLLRGLHAELAG